MIKWLAIIAALIFCGYESYRYGFDEGYEEGQIAECEERGEWLFKEITDDYHITGQCSVCKERRRIDNFCPNCGARMKGADDE